MEFDDQHQVDDEEGGGGGGGKKLLIVLGVVGGLCLCCCAGTLGGAYYLGKEMIGPFVEFQNAIVQAHQENPWSLPEDSVIKGDRFDVYLAARRQAVEAFRETAEKLKEIEGQEETGIGEAFGAAGSFLSSLKAWPDALVEHGMNPDEFRWMTEQAYGVWLAEGAEPASEAEEYTKLTRRFFLGTAVPEANAALFTSRKAEIEELSMFEFDKMIPSSQ